MLSFQQAFRFFSPRLLLVLSFWILHLLSSYDCCWTSMSSFRDTEGGPQSEDHLITVVFQVR